MDIRSIIDQLCKKEIQTLSPIDGVYKDLLSKKKSKDSFMFSFSSDVSDYDDIKLGTLTSKELLPLINELGEINFINHINREIFIYIQSQVKKASDYGAWNNENIWFEPNDRFVKWFSDNSIDPEIDILKREETNDSLWAIADNMRARKDNGEFDTYMDAYRWAEKNITKKGFKITSKNLERAYHKAKSEGKVGLKKTSKVSIPLMITNKMRLQLSTLGYNRDEMRYLTPEQCWKIINKGVPKKPSRERGRNQ
tara:strand:- start:93 stop:851 length:759 start_codon:yes stop_codon:yes gene_type:complete